MERQAKVLFVFLTWGFLAILLGGCGAKDDSVVAKVAGDKIYASELNDIFTRNRGNYASLEDEFNNRRTIVDSLVIQKLLVQEGYRRNIDKLEEVSRIVLANSDRFLLDVLYIQKILNTIKINDTDIKDFYNMLEYKVHATHIVVASKDTADMIIDSLRNGGNFENLAVQYSLDPQAKTTRGDLGYFIWGQMDPTFQENVFKLEPGQISEPFETRFGWHIARVIEKNPNELRGTFGQMSEQIKSSLENMKRAEALNNYRIQLSEKYTIRIDTVTCEYLLNKRKALYPPTILESLPKNDFDIQQLDRHESELIMANWDGGQLTLGQYLGLIKRLGAHQKPNLDDFDNLAKFIFQLKFQDILLAEARHLGLEDSPEYKEKIKKFKELTMADVMENDSLPMPGPPDEGEIRQYYEDHQGDFLIPARAYVYEILFNDLATASTYASKISSLERFKSMASQYTERSGKRATGGDLGWIDGRSYPRYFEEAQKSPLNKTIGPVQTGSKYALLYITEMQDEEVKDFLMVKQDIFDKISEEKKRTAFESWVEKQKSEAGIKIYENSIRATINSAKYADSTGS